MQFSIKIPVYFVTLYFWSFLIFISSSQVSSSNSITNPLLSRRGKGSYSSPGKTFVHLFEWSWNDIAIECETFLSKKGYDGVQISPPEDHIQGDPWWTRYQPVTYGLNSRSGTEEELRDMIQRCNAVGVNIYADAVINHMAASSGDHASIMGNSWGNRNYPGLYSANDFHHNDNNNQTNCQVNNYQDAHNVQYCDLTGLPDLATGSDYVRQTIQKYLDSLYNLGVKGLRIDAAKHQNVDELSQVISPYTDHFTFLEVISGNGEAVSPQQYLNLATVTEFNYGRSMASNVKQSGKFSNLQGFDSNFISSQKAVAFIDNHDTQRQDGTLTYKDGDVYYLATMFMLAYPYGTPKVMSSYAFSNHDQGPPSSPVHKNGMSSIVYKTKPTLTKPSFLRDEKNIYGNDNVNCNQGQWVCEHRHVGVSNMVKFRSIVEGQNVDNWNTLNNNCVAFSRGNKGAIAFNRDENNWCQGSVRTSLPDGQYCNIVANDDYTSCSGDDVISVQNGQMNFNMDKLSVVAIHTESKIN